LAGDGSAIASAMAASNVTAKRTFPKKGIQFMQSDIIFPHSTEKFQANPFAKRKFFIHWVSARSIPHLL
jgi:hypothetical protein